MYIFPISGGKNNQIKAKPKPNNVKISVSNIWHYSWSGSKGLGQWHFSGSGIHHIHSSSRRLRSTPLHTCHCPCWPFYGPGIFNMLGSLSQLRLHLHQWPFLDSSGRFQPCTQWPRSCGRFLHIAKYSCSLRYTLDPLCRDHSFCLLTLRKYSPQDIASVMLVFY